MTAPAWLAQRGGTVKLGSDGNNWYVVLNDQPSYRLTAVPAGGKFSCAIRQTNNGKRIESQGIFPTADEAIQAGLEDLRKALGW